MTGTQTTAQRWEVRGQSNYDFTPKAYWFGAGRYDDDRFSAYDYQASLAAGLGYKFVDTEKTKFWVQGGPGYRYSKERETGDTIDGVIFRGDLGFEQQITGTTRIVDLFLVESGTDNTYLQNNLGLVVTISGSLGLRVGYEVRYNTDVPPGIEKTDTLTTIGLHVRDQVAGPERGPRDRDPRASGISLESAHNKSECQRHVQPHRRRLFAGIPVSR